MSVQTGTSTRGPGPVDLRDLAVRYSTLLVLALMAVMFAVFVDRFLTAKNLLNILQQISMLTIVGVGLTFGFAARQIDLSVGYAAGLGGLAVPLMLVAGWPLPVALLLGLLMGVVVGAVNALCVTVIGVHSLITTLATGQMLLGVNFLLSGGRAVYGGMPELYLFLGQGRVLGGVPVVALIMLALVAVAWVLMERTFLGRRLYALGGNTRAAELAGIPEVRYKAIALMLCALFATLAGILLAARLGSGQPNAGENYLLDGLATVFIGMTVFRPGIPTVVGTFCGALFIGVINNGLNLMGLDTFVQDIVKGVIIIAAVSIIARQTPLKLI